jgi:hypothetical protein
LKIVFVLIFVLVIAVAAQATDYSVVLRSNYVGSVSGIMFHKGPVVQGCASFPVNTGYAGILFSAASGKEDGADEIDIFAGKNFGTIDCGVYYYALQPVGKSDGDYVAPYVDWAPKVKGSIKPFFHLEDDFSVEGLAGGFMYSGGIKTVIGKCAIKISLGGHPKTFGIPSESIAFVAMEGSIPIRGVDISLRLQKATGNDGGFAEDQITFSLSKSFTTR